MLLAYQYTDTTNTAFAATATQPSLMSVPDRTASLDLLALSLVPGLGPKLTALLLQHFGSAGQVRRASREQLQAVPKIGPKLAHSFYEALQRIDLRAELEQIAMHGIRLIPLDHEEYPAALRQITDAPPLLYCRGQFLAQDEQAIAFVGSRECTAYGRRMTERLVRGMVEAGYTIVSGLARGIDGVAHQAALAAGGRTIAVLAGGLSRIYPPEHTDLAERIVRQGVIMTETPMTVAPQPGMFPARNRLITGLAKGVVLIEAGAKSGALISADHAAEQGREVFALPGNVDSEASAGTNRLLRQGARLVRDADDILEDLQGLRPQRVTPATTKPQPSSMASSPSRPLPPTLPLTETPSASPPPPTPPVVAISTLSAAQRRIWEVLTEPKHADVITRETGLSSAEVLRELMQLEMKKHLRRLPGNVYERRSG